MSNRRTKSKQKRGPTRAPREDVPLDQGGDAELASGPASFPRLLALLKVAGGIVLVVGTAAAIAWGAHRYALTTPRFAIDDLVVEGTRRLSKDQVLQLAAIRRGDNVFSVDVERSETAVLTSPWIESARILRRLPGHVRIEIKERQPRALLVIDGRMLLVSDDGIPFKSLEPTDPHDLPLVTGLSAAALARNQKAELARLSEALGLLNLYDQLPLHVAYAAEELHLDERGHAVLTVGSEGTALHLGAGPWKQKLLRAVRVLGKSEAAGAPAGVVFLDNEAHPERVVVRLK